MNQLLPIYLDYAASTPVMHDVVEELLPYLTGHYSNPSNSIHPGGIVASRAIQKANKQIQELIGAWDYEVVYTSGATESINMVLKSLFQDFGYLQKQIVTCKTEHRAVLAVCDYLSELGAEIIYLDVDCNGNISLEQLEQSLNENTLAVCLMAVNNETGVIHDIEKISTICERSRTRFICDATQAIGKLPINLDKVPVDALVLSGHKIYAPKGVGALVLKKGIKMKPLIHGGGQQNNLRSGTLNVPGIVGIGKAAELLGSKLVDRFDKFARLQQEFESELIATGKVEVIGKGTERSPYISNVHFLQHEREEIIFPLSPKIYFSSGSACASEIVEPSHVLKAMGLKVEEADRCFRFSFGSMTTGEEIKEAIAIVKNIIA